MLRLAEMSSAELDALLNRSQAEIEGAAAACGEIIEAVRREGDAALLQFARQFDGVDLTARGLRVAAPEFDEADGRLSGEMRGALQSSIEHIRRFHEVAVARETRWVETSPGAWCGERWTPIDAVCLYVPRGRGSFSSVACMLGVPAKLAGVPRIILCTPPGAEGRVDDATLIAARMIGIDEVYRVGGAQAVAAVAFGTDTIPTCDKIVGPGNVYVSCARRMLSLKLDPGPPAGPSESLILCDATADPGNAAWNLLIEAEHGENSCAVLVTHAEALVEPVCRAVGEARLKLTEQRRRYVDEVLARRGGIVLTRSLDESIEFANRFAAEHVAVMVAEPWAVWPRIRHAGEILFGDAPIISLGNYAMGLNAILPTGGRARVSSGVGVQDFMKRVGVGFVTREGFEALRGVVDVMSRDEGFSAHHEAVGEWRMLNAECRMQNGEWRMANSEIRTPHASEGSCVRPPRGHQNP
ncbi:MAG: histidinol dehydrogenase [Phycisphaerales bacterium]|nr:histidinol dehydrogenase [Phycisphaerales bacterium]